MAPTYDRCDSVPMLSVRVHAPAHAGLPAVSLAEGDFSSSAFQGARDEADTSFCFGEGPSHAAEADPPSWGRAKELIHRVEDELAATLGMADLGDLQDAMQERALDTLHQLLDAAGIRRDERLIITVDESGRVDVEDHPQRDDVLMVLDRNPDVSRRLRDMAALALAERGRGDISRADSLLGGQGQGDRRLFQACLRGALSHCHLVRQ